MQRLHSTMTPQQFQAWIARHGYLTMREAAVDLGISVRALHAYTAGERRISMTLALLCQSLDLVAKLSGKPHQ